MKATIHLIADVDVPGKSKKVEKYFMYDTGVLFFILQNDGTVHESYIGDKKFEVNLEFSYEKTDGWQDVEELVEKLKKLYEDAKARLKEVKK